MECLGSKIKIYIFKQCVPKKVIDVTHGRSLNDTLESVFLLGCQMILKKNTPIISRWWRLILYTHRIIYVICLDWFIHVIAVYITIFWGSFKARSKKIHVCYRFINILIKTKLLVLLRSLACTLHNLTNQNTNEGYYRIILY